MEITPIQRGVHEVGAIPAAPVVEKLAEQRDVVQAVKAVNQSGMLGRDNELLFQRDRQTQRMVIRVVNRKTGEVVSQLPPEHVLRLAESSRGKG
jgi:flagellar protein FlaG